MTNSVSIGVIFSIIYMSHPPFQNAENAIFLPSPDHVGQLAALIRFVMGYILFESRSAMYILLTPFLDDTKASFFPVGENEGYMLSLPSVVSGNSVSLSRLSINMLYLPYSFGYLSSVGSLGFSTGLSEEKAISAPSAENVGKLSSYMSSVSFRMLKPDVSVIYMSLFPRARPAKTIFFPSGDIAGELIWRTPYFSKDNVLTRFLRLRSYIAIPSQ